MYRFLSGPAPKGYCRTTVTPFAFHYKAHLLRRADIEERVAGDSDDVGHHSRADPNAPKMSLAFLLTEYAGKGVRVGRCWA